MYPQAYKIIYTSVSIVVFIIAVLGFIFGFSRIDTEPDILKYITAPGFTLLSISFVLIWQGAGIMWASIFFAFSAPLIILISFSLGSYTYNFQIITMLALSLPSYIFYKKSNTVLLEKEEAIERIQEEQNLSSDRLKKDSELSEALNKKIDRYDMLKSLGEALNAKLSLGDICQLSIDKAYQIIPNTNEAKLFLLAQDTQELVLCFWRMSEESGIPSRGTDIFDKWAFEKRQPLRVPDVATDFRFSRQQADQLPEYYSLIIVPLVIQRRIIGLLHLGSKNAGAYTADDLRLLDFISDLLSAAINNARLYIQTQELAIRDSLTGLYVHRYFKERFQEEFTRCKEAKQPLSVLMLDIDHFKDYNDRYGHAAGDKVLKGVTDIIRKSAHEASIIARYGGEEFAVLFPGLKKREAEYIAEAIRKDIESATFILRRQDTKITVSGGLSSSLNDSGDYEELLKKVDFLLYKAKKEGRNKICSY